MKISTRSCIYKDCEQLHGSLTLPLKEAWQDLVAQSSPFRILGCVCVSQGLSLILVLHAAEGDLEFLIFVSPPPKGQVL